MIQQSHSWAYILTQLYFKKMCAPLCSKQHYSQRPRHGNNVNVHWQSLRKEVWLPWDRLCRETPKGWRHMRGLHDSITWGLISPQSHTRGLTEEVFKMTPAPNWMQPSKRSQTRTTQPSHTSSRPAETEKDKKWLLMLEATQSGGDLSQE